MRELEVTEQRALTAVLLLERVLSRKVTPIVALHEWPDIDRESDELLSASWHDLSHYSVDVDIRRKDPRYATYQADLLARRVEEIKQKFRIDVESNDSGRTY